jgi:uncharacterized membrane protein YeaQ/YmgE (transglycosylase-associated protein family)
VDHSCEKCGAAVEDGRPFCPQCRAPQIHVQVAVAAGEPAGERLAVEPPVQLPNLDRMQVGDRTLGGRSKLFDRSVAARSALKAGGLGVFAAMIPVIGILVTGWLAVYFYRRETGFAPAARICARIGAAAGLVVYAVNALFTILIIVFHAQQQVLDGLVKMAEKLGINTATAEFQASVQQLFTPAGLVKSFIAALVVSALGGALAALVLRHPPRG